MRKRPPLSFPQLLVCISLLCALTGALTLVASHTSPDRHFEQFTSQLFQEEMTGSTLNMHYTIADPKTFGISEYEPVLPIYHSDQPEDSKEHCSDLRMEPSGSARHGLPRAPAGAVQPAPPPVPAPPARQVNRLSVSQKGIGFDGYQIRSPF